MSTRTQRLISWARYLYWADMERIQFENWTNSQDDVDSPKKQAVFVALMSHWYASLWVVVEGWKEVPFADRIIDNLLETRSDLIQMLKRYRNGVYHFQPSVIDDRFVDFLSKEKDAVFLVCGLHHEFLRFLWELPRTCASTPEGQSQLRISMEEVLGWWPDDIPHSHIDELRNSAAEALVLSYTGTDPADTKSQGLRKAAHEAMVLADDALAELKDGLSAWCWHQQNEARADREEPGRRQP